MTDKESSRRAVLKAAAAGGVGAGLGAMGMASPAAAAPRRRRVAILLYDGLTALDAVGPYEVLCRVPDIEVITVARRAGPVRTDTGVLGLVADRSLRQVRQADVLLVPGAGNRGVTAAMADTETVDWVRRLHKGTTWTTSVCTGALILGAAGLLRGVPATTYWASRSYLETTFGAVLTPGRFVESGKIITAGGVSAGIDMALHLAAKLADERAAQALQLAVEYDPQPPFDTGSPEKAGPELQQLALKLLEDAAR
ncbi:Tat (twin-arginine translocation) pathway signal sequence [Nonomuraea solani]|uniref:Tat (Twin-arginine translocation) pathway signal sequence n=1 Tax=Nonomuraea solani TaxID=1144553 RepID=A0A1H6ERX7_9ACTN|nr:DJ-1/PfpI family protein [Nonomuraea solani]SEG99766.1 Tat (twin-arginine translocation) pathway signal sequence [Nonomuraea solani]